jgi:hypothetical protein
MPPYYILSKLQTAIRTTGAINAIIKPGEVAVLADNKGPPVICNWQWQITFGARYRVTTQYTQF